MSTFHLLKKSSCAIQHEAYCGSCPSGSSVVLTAAFTSMLLPYPKLSNPAIIIRKRHAKDLSICRQGVTGYRYLMCTLQCGIDILVGIAPDVRTW